MPFFGTFVLSMHTKKCINHHKQEILIHITTSFHNSFRWGWFGPRWWWRQPQNRKCWRPCGLWLNSRSLNIMKGILIVISTTKSTVKNQKMSPKILVYIKEKWTSQGNNNMNSGKLFTIFLDSSLYFPLVQNYTVIKSKWSLDQ